MQELARCLLFLFLLPLASQGAKATPLSAVDLFGGDIIEDFEGFARNDAPTTFSVFAGLAHHNQLSGTRPFVWISSTSDTTGALGPWGLGYNGFAKAADGNQGFGMEGHAHGEFVFSVPISSFGAFFGTGMLVDSMFVRFFDQTGSQIGPEQSFVYFSATGILDWHGWTSTTPIARVEWGALSPTAVSPAIDSVRVVLAIPEATIPVLLLSGLWALRRPRCR